MIKFDIPEGASEFIESKCIPGEIKKVGNNIIIECLPTKCKDKKPCPSPVERTTVIIEYDPALA